jgi:group II intron reverse transcriptase/maturase
MNLAYLLNEENLKSCFWQLEKNKATGIDGVNFEEYKGNLDNNLKSLVTRMKTQTYKPQPVRRVYIPKANGKLRPLGIPSLEDKIVQKGMGRILESIYEEEFLDFSYGFRPKRSCHDALKKLSETIFSKRISYIIDADIKGFFDNVDHDWMIKFLEHRIDDKNFTRLIRRFLRNGYMEDGVVKDVETGTPQGGIVSPILANIYLHYVLDLWIEKVVKPKCLGDVEIVRYADDFVICCQYANEANKILAALKDRMKKFNLELAEDKTRLVKFGRFSRRDAKKKSTRPQTFNFLGFTHYVSTGRQGKFKVGRKTEKKKFKLAVQNITQWLKEVKNFFNIVEIWNLLKSKMVGHYRYYGVSENFRGIRRFYWFVLGSVYKWINRRSQKMSFTWDQFHKYLQRHPLPIPKIHHNFYNSLTRTVKTNEEPYVGNLQVRFREGYSAHAGRL